VKAAWWLLLLIVASAGRVDAESVWLVVVASDPSPAAIAAKANHLAADVPGAIVVQTADCQTKPSMFAVARVTTSAADAKALLEQVRPRVKDAYVKQCQAATGSLVSLRIPAVDASIANVPVDAVNWDDTDRVSSATALSNGVSLVTVRYYTPSPEDPLEGRRERLVVARSPQDRAVVTEQCASPGGVVARDRTIALHCAREQAGDELLHAVLVFNTDGKTLAEIKRCRNPRWTGDMVLSCEAESVSADGHLTLKPKTTEVNAAATPQ